MSSDSEHLDSEQDEQDELEELEEESSADEGNSFLDVEAAEDGFDEESSNRSDEDEPVFFPQFCKLPVELRQHIWELFDPDMRLPGRVFNFRVLKNRKPEVWEGASLDQQTESARAVLSTHRESRQWALKFYPDTVAIRKGQRLVRFNKDKDIVLLEGVPSEVLTTEQWITLVAELGDIRHLAFHTRLTQIPNPQTVFEGLQSSQKVKGIYYLRDANDTQPYHLTWCISDQVNHYHLHGSEEGEYRVPYPVDFLYCWPNIEEHLEYAEQHLRESSSPPGSPDDRPEIPHDAPRVWPLIEFGLKSGLRRYHKIKQAVSEGGIWEDNWQSDSDSEEGSDEELDDDEIEYESEGIDDESIDEDGELDEEDDDFIVQDDASAIEAPGYGAFSDEEADDDVVAHGEEDEVIANFSSPDPEPSAADDEDDSAPVGQHTRGVKRARHRAIASDSDDEDADEDDEESRPAKRRARVVLSESDDERGGNAESERPRHAKRRRGVVESEDEDEAVEEAEHLSDEDVNDASERATSQEEESDEETDEKPKTGRQERKPTLAERLNLFRAENPVEDSESNTERGSDDGAVEAEEYAGYEDDDCVQEQDWDEEPVLDLADEDLSDREGAWED